MLSAKTSPARSLFDPASVTLGKLDARHDPRTLKYGSYRTGAASAPWRAAHWGNGLTYGMLGNDQYGDCVEAEYAHHMQVMAARTSKPFALGTTDVLGAYSAITGFRQGDPSTDRGTDMLSACNYWRSTGMGGLKIDAFASVSPQSTAEVKESVAWYGGLSIGLALPVSAQSQVGGVWDVVSGSSGQAGSWGGHCVPVVGYTPYGLWLVTWGALQRMTWSFLSAYCDEAFVYLAQEWIGAAGVSPSNFAWGQLSADLANL